MGGPLSKGDYRGQFEAEGYAVLRGVFTAGEVAEMAAAFDRIQARALAGGRSWRDRNTFFLLGDDEKLGRALRFAQWPAWNYPALERVRRDPRLPEILAPPLGRHLNPIITPLH